MPYDNTQVSGSDRRIFGEHVLDVVPVPQARDLLPKCMQLGPLVHDGRRVRKRVRYRHTIESVARRIKPDEGPAQPPPERRDGRRHHPCGTRDLSAADGRARNSRTRAE